MAAPLTMLSGSMNGSTITMQSFSLSNELKEAFKHRSLSFPSTFIIGSTFTLLIIASGPLEGLSGAIWKAKMLGSSPKTALATLLQARNTPLSFWNFKFFYP